MKRILGIAVGIMVTALSLLGGDRAAVTVKVPAEVAGKVKAVRVIEGQRVRRGQILAILENDDYAAECMAAVAELHGAKTKSEVAAARARMDKAYAAWYRTFVRAPMAGVVVRTNLQPGDSIAVARQTAVLTLTGTSPQMRADAFAEKE